MSEATAANPEAVIISGPRRGVIIELDETNREQFKSSDLDSLFSTLVDLHSTVMRLWDRIRELEKRLDAESAP